MKVKKYYEFIKEADELDLTDGETDNIDGVETDTDVEENDDYVGNETPEYYIKNKLNNIKSKIEKMFSDVNDDTQSSDGDVDNDNNEMSFTDLGMKLDNIEMSFKTKTHQNLTVKFSDEKFYYSLLFRIDLKQVTGKKLEPGEGMSTDMIKRVFVKFKKYDGSDSYKLIGEMSKMADIEDIDEDFLVSLKVDLDDEIGDGGDEDFSIEYD